MKKTLKYLLLSICLICLFTSCEELVEISSPENELVTENVFSDSLTINGAVAQMYVELDKSISSTYDKYLSLLTDEVDNQSSSKDLNEWKIGKLSVENANVNAIWSRFYSVIYQANSIITELEGDNLSLSSGYKNYLAEAKFIRAFCFYHLFNSFGEIPLVLSPDVKKEAGQSRRDSVLVFQQIRKDLEDSSRLIEDSKFSSKTRLNIWALKAFRSQLALHQEQWGDAEDLSSEIINSQQFPLQDIAKVFKSSSKETILSIWTQNGFVTKSSTILPATGRPPFTISKNLLSLFADNDKRKINWIGNLTISNANYSYPFKYQNRTSNTSNQEYLIVFRSAEQYLIRAEARNMLGRVEEAIGDLNKIRERAGVALLSTNLSQSECGMEIRNERRRELFMEWGQRYVDLKRYGSLTNVMRDVKQTWSEYSEYLPIPQTEIMYNPNLKQNKGY